MVIPCPTSIPDSRVVNSYLNFKINFMLKFQFEHSENNFFFIILDFICNIFDNFDF